jgi:hypothetical protein
MPVLCFSDLSRERKLQIPCLAAKAGTRQAGSSDANRILARNDRLMTGTKDGGAGVSKLPGSRFSISKENRTGENP